MSRPGLSQVTQQRSARPKQGDRSARSSFVMELPEDLRERLEAEAKQMDLTMGQIFSLALDLYTKALDTLDQGGTITFEIPNDPNSPYVVNRRGGDELGRKGG